MASSRSHSTERDRRRVTHLGLPVEDITLAPSTPPRAHHKRRRGSSSVSHRLHDVLKNLNVDDPQATRTRTTGNTTHASESTAFLTLTNERLARETARAEEAERQAAQILSHFKSAHEAKLKLEADFLHLQTELSICKVQLDLAQQETERVNRTLKRAERERTEAEDEARRTKEKLRKILAERAVDHAKEQGRRMGYEEGLRQGRAHFEVEQAFNEAIALPHDPAPVMRPKKDISKKSRSRSDSANGRSRKSNQPEEPRHSRRDGEPRYPQGYTPDVAIFSTPPPIPLITTPVDVAVPRTQPQLPVTPEYKTPNVPESITILKNDSTPQWPPIPIHSSSPKSTHRPFVPPPENYTATMNTGSKIHFPPPHEMSHPIPPTSGVNPNPTIYSARLPSPILPPRSIPEPIYGRPKSRQTDHDDEDDEEESPFIDMASLHSRRTAPRYPHRGTTSIFSDTTGGHLSQLDLLSPPNDDQTPYQNYVRRMSFRPDSQFMSPTSTLRSTRRRAATVSDSGWKEKEVGPYGPPRAPAGSSSNTVGSSATSVGVHPPEQVKRTKNPIEIPVSAYETTRPASRSASGRVAPQVAAQASRKAREVTLPMSISNVLAKHGLGVPEGSRPGTAPGPPPGERTSSPDHRRTASAPAVAPEVHHTQRHQLNREESRTSVPGIEVVTPSTHTEKSLRMASGRTTVEPLLLTPESAHAIPLPPLPVSKPPQPAHSNSSLGLIFAAGEGVPGTGTSSGFYGNPRHHRGRGDADVPEDIRISIGGPDANQAGGFVPLSPIPGMENLRPYPPGFALGSDGG